MTREFYLQTEETLEDETILMNMQIPWCREVFYEHFSTLSRFRQTIFLQGKLLRRRIGKDVLQQLDPHPREAFRAAIVEEGARSQDMQWFLDDLSCDTLHGDRLLTEEGLVFLANLLWAFSWRGLPDPEDLPQGYAQKNAVQRSVAAKPRGEPQPNLVELVLNLDPKGGAVEPSVDMGSRTSTGGLSTMLSTEFSDFDIRDAKKKRKQKSSHFVNTMHTPRSTASKDSSCTHSMHRPWHY